MIEIFLFMCLPINGCLIVCTFCCNLTFFLSNWLTCICFLQMLLGLKTSWINQTILNHISIIDDEDEENISWVFIFYQTIIMNSTHMHRISSFNYLMINIDVDYLLKVWTTMNSLNAIIRLLIMCMHCYFYWCTSLHLNQHAGKNINCSNFSINETSDYNTTTTWCDYA